MLKRISLKMSTAATSEISKTEVSVLSSSEPSPPIAEKDDQSSVTYEKSVSVKSPRLRDGVQTFTETEKVTWHLASGKKRTCFVEPKFDLKAIKVVSFDLDDTLWACEQVIEKAEAALHKHLNERGYKHMSEELRQPGLGRHQRAVLNAHPHKAHDVTFIRQKVIQSAADEMKVSDQTIVESAFQQFYHARTFHVSEHLFPGAVEAVARLKRIGLRIGTISNGNADVLKVPELAHFVEHHINPIIAGAAKPSRVPFDMLRELFGVEAHEILHVGDSLESDVNGAINAGMKACWVTIDPPETSDRPDVMRVMHVSELADLFEQVFGSVENMPS